MPSSQNGNVGINSGYTAGDNGWTVTHNLNWDALDALVQCNAINATTTTPPSSPANGDCYIVPTGATGAWSGKTNDLAVWVARTGVAAWVFYAPKNGWTCYDKGASQLKEYNGTAWSVVSGGGGGGTVTSVALSAPSEFTITGSPVTASGTLGFTKNNQNANLVYAGPASGAAAPPTFRALVGADIPVFVASGASHAPGGVPDPGSTAGTTRFLREDGTWIAPGSSGSTNQPPVDAQTGTSYTLALTDAPSTSAYQGIVTMNNAAANTLTVPPNSSVAFPVGTTLQVVQLGIGQTTIAAGAGVTINSASSLLARGQYSTLVLTQIAANTWIVSGDMQ